MTRRDPSRGDSVVSILGRHAVRAALDSDHAELLELKLSRSLSAPERRALRERAAAQGVPCEELSRDALDRYTGASRHDQGVGARVRLLRLAEPEALLAEARGRGARRPLRVLALDGVSNSQNVGMVVRSVVGAGLDGLLWPLAGQPWVNGLVVRAAAGALFECPILRCATLVEGLASLQAGGFTAYGLVADAPRSLFAAPPAHRAVYVLGSETSGLSDAVDAMLDERLSIPMAGRLESLNVAVSAGLVAFHAAGLLAANEGDGGGDDGVSGSDDAA